LSETSKSKSQQISQNNVQAPPSLT